MSTKSYYDEIASLYLDTQGKYFDWVCSSVHGDDKKRYRNFTESEKKLFDKIKEVCEKADKKEGSTLYVR